MRFFTKGMSAFFAVLLVAVLSLGVAAPSHAATNKPHPRDGWTYKQYWDYKEAWNREMSETIQQYGPQPEPKVHPSGPKPGRTQSKSTKGKILHGRIMGPDEKIPFIPDVAEPKPGAGTGLAKFLSPLRFLGISDLGMGSKGEIPSNAVEIYRGQGVSESCISNDSACSAADLKKKIEVNGCSLTDTCSTYTPKAADTELEVRPMPSDMWGILTNQTDEKQPPAPDSHYNWTSTEGCTYTPTVVNSDIPGMVGADFEIKFNGNRPTSPVPREYYDSRCGTGTYAPRAPSGYEVYAVCTDADGNGVGNGGASFNKAFSAGQLFPKGTVVSVCSNTNHSFKPPVNVVSLTFIQTTPMQGSIEKYSNGVLTHWVNPDPNVHSIGSTQVTTSFQCQDANGAVYNYTISQQGAASWPVPICPEGTRLKSYDVKQSNGTGTPSRTLGGATVKDSALAAYPDCVASGCALSVYVDGEKCAAGRADCEIWSQIRSKQPSRVLCKWGSYTVNSTNCLSLAEAFKSERGTIYDPESDTIVSVDEDGKTDVNVNPTPWNPTNPNPVPGTPPGTKPDTGTGTGTGSDGFPTTGTNPEVEGENCMAGAWSWNPVDWVLVPLKCAFVPTKPVMQRVDTVTLALDDKIPMVWFTPITAGPGGGSCPDWQVHVKGLDRNVICESSFTAAIRGARMPLFNLVSVAMVWPLLRGIWYGLIPIVRVTPSK